MDIHADEPGSVVTRFFLSWLLFIWRWSFRLISYGALIWLVLNWNWLSLRLFIAPRTSLVRHLVPFLLLLLLVQFFVSLIHELGHLLAGYLVGLRLHLFIIGPFRIVREAERLRFRVRGGLGIFNGLTASIPHSAERIPMKMGVFAFGGPFLSLIACIASGAIFFWAMQNKALYEARAWVWELFLITAVFSLITFFSTMRPGAYANGYPTDGGRIAILLENSNRAKSWVAQVLLNAAEIQNIRPQAWEAQLIQQATISQPHSIDALMGNLLAYYWALDRGNIEKADLFLEQATKERYFVAGGFKLKILLENAYFSATHKKDVEAAEEWLMFIRRPTKQLQPQFYRAKTAVSLLQNNQEEANSYYQLAQESYQNVDQKNGLWQAEVDWLNQLMEK